VAPYNGDADGQPAAPFCPYCKRLMVLIRTIPKVGERLAQAEANVAKPEHVARQRALITDLERLGHDATFAKGLLKVFSETQMLHEQHRDRLHRELMQKGSSTAPRLGRANSIEIGGSSP
jgi:hypothetical protein